MPELSGQQVAWHTMRRKVVLALVIVGTLAALGTWPNVMGWIFGGSPGNRHALYAVRNKISPGIDRQELLRVVGESQGPTIHYKWVSAEEMTIWTPVALMEQYYLSVYLQEGRVVHARIRGTTGEDRLDDAPPDF